MTEEDTIRILSRPSFNEVWEYYLEFIKEWQIGFPEPEVLDVFFRRYGWTYDEVLAIKYEDV